MGVENPHPSHRRAASIKPHVPQKRKALGLSVWQLLHSIGTDGTAHGPPNAHQNLIGARPTYTTPYGRVSAVNTGAARLRSASVLARPTRRPTVAFRPTLKV